MDNQLQQQQSEVAVAAANQPAAKDRSQIAFILGIIGLVAWFIPIIGIPVQIVGLVFAVKSLKFKRWQATTAVVLCIIGLVLSVINSSIGAYMGYLRGISGTH